MDDNKFKILVGVISKLDDIYKEVAEGICGNKDAGCQFCCSGCASVNGHFQYGTANQQIDKKHLDDSGTNHKMRCKRILDYVEAVDQITHLKKMFEWDADKGFLGNAGCKIPRLGRSVYCQETLCNALKQRMTDGQIEEVKKLINIVKNIRISEDRIF